MIDEEVLNEDIKAALSDDDKQPEKPEPQDDTVKVKQNSTINQDNYFNDTEEVWEIDFSAS